MKTQRTKLVARIAVALLAGMMVLALAGCGSKNPLIGNTYTGSADGDMVSMTFKKDGKGSFGDDEGAETFTYKINSDGTGAVQTEDGETMSFTYSDSYIMLTAYGMSYTLMKQ